MHSGESAIEQISVEKFPMERMYVHRNLFTHSADRVSPTCAGLFKRFSGMLITSTSSFNPAANHSFLKIISWIPISSEEFFTSSF